MRLLEHQSKKLLMQFGLKMNEPELASNCEEAVKAVARVGLPAVLKAQVPFGGRKKAGAVIFVTTSLEARQGALTLFEKNIREFPVKEISIERQIKFGQEVYLGVAWDLAIGKPIALVSPMGGVEVESFAQTSTVSQHIDPLEGLLAFRGREMALQAGFAGKQMTSIGAALEKLTRAFLACDAVTMEINPYVETSDGGFIGLDAHVEIDDDAFFRQKSRLACLGEIYSSGTVRPPTPLEREAARIDAMDHRGVAGRVVEFDGDLALLIGGGGASLTVFDAIKKYHGRPANYCEIGGNPTEEKVAALTALLMSKPGVKKLAVIMNVVNNTRADVIARGVLSGLRESGCNPVETICVFRIPGSWEKEAADLMREAGIEACGREISLDKAAKMAVERMEAYAY